MADQLHIPRLQREINQPFEGDLLQRSLVADKLDVLLSRLNGGAVLSIDAAWGDGKTWFGLHWKKRLEQNGHKVVYVDTFQHDYIDDPFTLIASELDQLFSAHSEDSARAFRRSAEEVMRTLLPVGLKILIRTMSRVLLGSADLGGELRAASEATAEALQETSEALVKERIERHLAERQSIENFRRALANCAKESFDQDGKPLVFVIDELDRCRPSFSVSMIERIKHFFDVPNLVFVLLLNRNQLENAIRGVYGQSTDAVTYLSKFVNFSVNLPAPHRSDNRTRAPCARYLRPLIDKYSLGFRAQHVNDFLLLTSIFGTIIPLSLRDLEKISLLFAISDCEYIGLLSYACVLKVRRPDLYIGLRNGESASDLACLELLSSAIKQSELGNGDQAMVFLNFLRIQHAVRLGKAQENELRGDYYDRLAEAHFGTGDRREWAYCFDSIDLSISP